MQTFLPYPDFRRSLECLDNKRLGNQVYRECKTLVAGGWRNHPASRMWRGYEYALCEYAIIGLVVLRSRGRHYPNHLVWFLTEQQKLLDTGIPPWLGDRAFHDSHKSNLLRKDPQHYGKFGWDVPDNLPYVWPVGKGDAE